MHRLARIVPAVLVALPLAACGPAVSNEDAARRAVEGLEPALTRIIQLGFDGYNAANSANIPEMSEDGDETGTLTVSGQVSQSNSDNREMNLLVGMSEYSDGPIDETTITYDTPEGEEVVVDLSLRNIPDGTVTGSVAGDVVMSGDLSGPLTLAFAVSGNLQAGENDDVELVDGGTDITGSATSEYGEFALDFSF